MKTLTHYDLFAGIGGFSLAVDTIFHDYEIKHIFSEWEQFPTAVLKKHWPEGTYYGDIADLVADNASERLQNTRNNTERRFTKFNETHENKTQGLCILTGGFPCQPFSHAGRRKGTSDDRYKWPEMFEVIRNVRPDWVIAENVRGLASWNDGMVLETVCADLEAEGYEVRPYIIPACSKGAPHRRERVWIVANTGSTGSGTPTGENTSENRKEGSEEREYPQHRTSGQSGVTTNPRHWNKDWREVALATCHDRVDDEFSREVDGVPYSFAKWREEGLKAYGNAIVPAVAQQILKAIRTSEEITS